MRLHGQHHWPKVWRASLANPYLEGDCLYVPMGHGTAVSLDISTFTMSMVCFPHVLPAGRDMWQIKLKASVVLRFSRANLGFLPLRLFPWTREAFVLSIDEHQSSSRSHQPVCFA